MFDAYEMRSPERKDDRDPLLLGRCEGKWYRIALWGESLLPLKRISKLVQESLVIKARTANGSSLSVLAGRFLQLCLRRTLCICSHGRIIFLDL